MKRNLKIVALVLLGIFMIMQFIRPDRNESGYESVAYFENETKPNAQIQSILKNNCYDCHSNQTVCPWYANVAPISFWLDHHIEEGKEHFNVSGWEQYSPKKKDHKLEELIEEVEEGEMPLDSYTWTHGNLSQKDAALLIKWANQVRSNYIIE